MGGSGGARFGSDFITVLKENVFIFNATLLSVEVGVSVAAYSELLDESKFAFFPEFAGQ